MVRVQAIFKYKTVKCPLHRLPALLKFFMLLPLSIFCMSLSPLWLSVGIITAFIFAFFCKFTMREQLTDIKPAFYYAALLYALSVFSILFENWNILSPRELAAVIFIPHADFLRISLRLVLIIQLSALLFRTTSFLEIRDSFYTLESFFSRLPFFRKRKFTQSRFAENISLFLCFIPEIFSNWTLINNAWKARGGKQGLGKIKTTVFVLISICMEKASIKAKALEARTMRLQI